MLSHSEALKALKTGDDPESLIGLSKPLADDLKAYLERLAKLAVGSEPCELTQAELIEMVNRLNPDVPKMSPHMPFTRIMRQTAHDLFTKGLVGDPDDVARFRWIMKTWDNTGQIPLKDG